MQGNTCWTVNPWVGADYLLAIQSPGMATAIQRRYPSCQLEIWGSSGASDVLHSSRKDSGKKWKWERNRNRRKVLRNCNEKAVSDQVDWQDVVLACKENGTLMHGC